MPTLSELRTSLTAEHRAILNTIFDYEQRRDVHMPVIGLYGIFGGEQAVESALSVLRDQIILSHPSHGGRRRYGLKFLGCLLTDRGEQIQDLLVRYFEFVQAKLEDDPELHLVNFNDLKEQAFFSEDELEIFKKIIFHTPFHNGDAGNIPPNVDQWFGKDLNSYIEKIALREYSAHLSTTDKVVPGETNTLIAGVLNQFQLTESTPWTTPDVITRSLQSFNNNHPDPTKVGFVIMRFGDSEARETIFQAIANTLELNGFTAVRADDKEYHDDLFYNVLTYLHGCGFGIAVFEHVEEESFNPNVAFEVGYIMALQKRVCLLKDQRLPNLHTDLTGKLHRNFDMNKPTATISKQLALWLKAKDIVS